jgi:hypothetical protein
MIETGYPPSVSRALADLDILGAPAAAEQALEAFLVAREKHMQATIDLAEAEAALDLLEAEQTHAGLAGSNEAQRKAALLLAVAGTHPHAQVTYARAALKRADLAVAMTEARWKLARERMQLGAALLRALGGH